MFDGINVAVPNRAARAALGVVAALLALLLLIAAAPWGIVLGLGVDRFTAALGRPVHVGHVRRVDWFSLVPTVELSDVTIAQPRWAGRGTMARIAQVRVTAPVLPLLVGRFHPHALAVTGLELELVRDATGRNNWSGDPHAPRRRSSPPRLAALTIANSRVHLVDARRHVELAGALASAPSTGLTVDATGTLRGKPLRLALRGAALGGADPRRPYPLRAQLRSPLVSIDAAAMLDHALDLNGFTAQVRASGEDLSYLDDIIQAGLFPTRHFRIAGLVRRDGGSWTIRRLDGSFGRSVLSAKLKVDQANGRTRLAGAVDAATFDFDDFASDAQRARGAAKRAATGPRLIPDTRLKLDGVARLDGTVRFAAHRLLAGDQSPFRSLSTELTLDHRRLVLAPLGVGMVSGGLSGSAVVNDRGRAPDVTLDLRVRNAAIQALIVKSGAIAGPLAMRAKLRGHGDTLRAAMANADGRLGVATTGGTVRRDYATFLGGDVVKSVGAAIGGGASGRVGLRCLVGNFAARNGRLVPQPLVLDTASSRADGTGTIDLGSERIDLQFRGRAKDPGLLQSTAPTRVFGTLTRPQIDIRPPRAPDQRKAGLLDRVGFLIKGLRVGANATQALRAPDADCRGLAAQALR